MPSFAAIYSNLMSFRGCAKRIGGTCCVPAPAHNRFLVAFAPRNDKNFEITWPSREHVRTMPSDNHGGPLPRRPPPKLTHAYECVRRYAKDLSPRHSLNRQ